MFPTRYENVQSMRIMNKNVYSNKKMYKIGQFKIKSPLNQFK